ncbi:radical SAM protein [Chloroflexota bacterium]
MTKKIEIQDLPLWEELSQKNIPFSFELELTARCNNNCRHCYINLPAGDKQAALRELTLKEIELIADQAADLGSVWCLLTGGEPLLRSDFKDIYLMLKKKGFLINVFTNGCLINDHHIQLFKQYPPRDIEMTVYGVTQETYEAVTRVPGSFKTFQRGLDLLLSNGIGVTLKAMALRSNQHEIAEISKFCREKTKLPFRYDPMLHLRYDHDPIRNEEIKQERLDPKEIVALEISDQVHFQSMQEKCDNLILPESLSYEDCSLCEKVKNCEEYKVLSRLFQCGIGKSEFSISYNGQLRLCSSLSAPGTTFDLKTGSIREGLEFLSEKIWSMNTSSTAILKSCKSCNISNLCAWCPATAYLETGDLEGEVDFFCEIAHGRAAALKNALSSKLQVKDSVSTGR